MNSDIGAGLACTNCSQIWFQNLPQCEDCLLGLQWLVVGELDHMWDWGEQRLVYVDLGIRVNAVVADVKELDDLGFWELFDDALAGALILDQLTGNLHNNTTNFVNSPD